MPQTLNRNRINQFFRLFSKHLDEKATVLLTGAAAGNILGKARPSADIDFAIRMAQKDPEMWEKIEVAVQKTVRATGIQANYAEDIDRWGLISLLDYLHHTLPYQQFGQIKVEVLSPAYWSIGKMTRYLAPDIEDMVRVFKKQKIPYPDLVRLWGLALRKSPKSTALFTFRKHVEDFLKSYGRQIWQKSFDADKAIGLFYRSARIPKLPS